MREISRNTNKPSLNLDGGTDKYHIALFTRGVDTSVNNEIIVSTIFGLQNFTFEFMKLMQMEGFLHHDILSFIKRCINV